MRNLSIIFALAGISILLYALYQYYIEQEEIKKNNNNLKEQPDKTIMGNGESKETEKEVREDKKPYLEIDIPSQAVAGTGMNVIIKAKNLKGTKLLLPAWSLGTGNLFEAKKLSITTDDFSTVAVVKTKYLDGLHYPVTAKFVVEAVRGGTETVASWEGSVDIYAPKNPGESEDFSKYYVLTTIPRLDGDTLRITFKYHNKWGSPVRYVTFEEVKTLGSVSKTYDVKIITREVTVSHTFTYTKFMFKTNCTKFRCRTLPEKKKFRIKLYNWKNELLDTITKVVTVYPDGFISVSGEGGTAFPKPPDEKEFHAL